MITPESFIEFLKGRGWVRAGEISLLANDRYLRQLANQSEGKIISGQLGYKLTKEAEEVEILHSVNWLRSQALNMLIRARQIEEFSGLKY